MYIIFLYEHGILAGMSVLQVAGCRVLDSWWVPLHTPPVGTSEQEPDSYPRKPKRCSMHPGTACDYVVSDATLHRNVVEKARIQH